jgi:CheY-like chemotaxis protein
VKKIRLLIVEDNLDEQQAWERQLAQHNALAADSGGFTLGHTFAATKDEALEKIEHADFDAAIVDLGLATSDGHQEANTAGNDVVAALVQSELAVVVIFTGQPGDALPPHLRGPNVSVIPKGGVDGDGTQQVMSLLSKNAPMILTIRAAQLSIKKEMAALFSKSIWPRWKLWLDGKQHPDTEVTAAVSRHLASHVYAVLLEKAEQKLLSEEWYFVPPIREGLRTGDLIEFKEEDAEAAVVAIVITPRCDLANNPNNKNQTYQIALCDDMSEEWAKRQKKYREALACKPKDGSPEKEFSKWGEECKKTRESVRGLTQHRNNTTNFHFIHELRMPDGTTRGPFLIRFDKVRSLDRQSPRGQALSTSTRIASVAPEFLPSLVERLGSYFSRIGTPDYSFTE